MDGEEQGWRWEWEGRRAYEERSGVWPQQPRLQFGSNFQDVTHYTNIWRRILGTESRPTRRRRLLPQSASLDSCSLLVLGCYFQETSDLETLEQSMVRREKEVDVSGRSWGWGKPWHATPSGLPWASASPSSNSLSLSHFVTLQCTHVGSLLYSSMHHCILSSHKYDGFNTLPLYDIKLLFVHCMLQSYFGTFEVASLPTSSSSKLNIFFLRLCGSSLCSSSVLLDNSLDTILRRHLPIFIYKEIFLHINYFISKLLLISKRSYVFNINRYLCEPKLTDHIIFPDVYITLDRKR